jgi:HSP20 family protein
MSLPAHRHPTPARYRDLFDWFDAPWTTVMPFGTSHHFRVEDYTEDGHYVVRAELPDLDPDKDIEVTVESNVLSIHAERHEETKVGRRSEFRYGALTRSIALPEGAEADKITAKYDKGMLEISVPIPKQAEAASRRVAVERPK